MVFMIFIGTVNVGNIVAPEMLRQTPVADKIVSNSTGSGSSNNNNAQSMPPLGAK
ncbi:MAG: hypothetical protein M3270_00655 [Thermoproteota archaeon]|nr:hypothetical protein [Thermoproteota archaeon]